MFTFYYYSLKIHITIRKKNNLFVLITHIATILPNLSSYLINKFNIISHFLFLPPSINIRKYLNGTEGGSSRIMYRPPLLAPEASLYCSQIRVNQLRASWLNKIDRKGHTRLSNTWPYKTERGIYRLVNNILNSSPSVRAGNVSSLSLSLWRGKERENGLSNLL